MIDLAIKILKPSWREIYRIPRDSFLEKGRQGLYHAMSDATGLVKEKFGCYAWAGNETIFYCGSFNKDYKRQDFKSNFHGRIHSYLQSHSTKKSGEKNTNLVIFENINDALHSQDIALYILKFDILIIGEEKVDYIHYSQDAELVRAVEQLLICTYKRSKQCIWNRA